DQSVKPQIKPTGSRWAAVSRRLHQALAPGSAIVVERWQGRLDCTASFSGEFGGKRQRAQTGSARLVRQLYKSVRQRGQIAACRLGRKLAFAEIAGSQIHAGRSDERAEPGQYLAQLPIDAEKMMWRTPHGDDADRLVLQGLDRRDVEQIF